MSHTETSVALTNITADTTEENVATRTSESTENSQEYPHGLRLAIVTSALILSIFLSAFDSTVMSTLVPAITDHFGSLSQTGWYSSSYPLANAAFLTFWGKAYAQFPLKHVYTASVTLFEAGNLISGSASTSAMLIFGRALAGMGGAGVMSGCFIIIAFIAKPELRPSYMSIIGFTFSIASVAGPLLGGTFVDKLSWRWGFWFNVPIGVFAMVLMHASLRIRRPASRLSFKDKLIHMDIPGALVILAAMASFIQAMHHLGTLNGLHHPATKAFLAAFFLLTGVFLYIEYRMSDFAMLQLKFLKQQRFTGNVVFIFFFGGFFFSLLFSLPVQFQSVDNASASASGLRSIPLVLGVSIFTMVSNYLLQRFHQNLPLLVTGGILGAIGSVLIYALSQTTSLSTWIVLELIVATGVGIALQLPMIDNQASVSVDNIPSATAMTLFFETAGQALFTAAGEAAFTSKLIKSIIAQGRGIDPQSVIGAGATGFRKSFTAEQIPYIVRSYVVALKANYLISCICGCLAGAASLTMTGPYIMRKLARATHSQ